MRNCRYDPATGSVVFVTNHFSRYAVGYNKVMFTDVAETAWYAAAVDFSAARGITTGIGNDMFNPDGHLTRGQFLVMAMRAFDIRPAEQPEDNFADAGNDYYTDYLAEAKRLGISNGVGNNRFAPERVVSRQEMCTLLYKTLMSVDVLPEATTEQTLAGYKDATQVAPWAKEALSLFAGTGIVSGREGSLAPNAPSTRAQMAQMLYNLLSK